ncbi:hypothetical protein [Streptomyces sp. NBC_00986]|uniref:hypothetical protein n=1 Tax=Streptomyces sp. NBC_00986 TaxID=2903702 RepID=UPI00386989E7|nr:hypothetical protein OG504_34735 [Streptomyces sp. NBC_00986]
MGEFAASVEACDQLLALPDLPTAIRRQTVTDREFSAPHAAAVPRPSNPARRPKASRAGKAARSRKK